MNCVRVQIASYLLQSLSGDQVHWNKMKDALNTSQHGLNLIMETLQSPEKSFRPQGPMLSSGCQGPSSNAEQGWSWGHREEASPKRVKVKQTNSAKSRCPQKRRIMPFFKGKVPSS